MTRSLRRVLLWVYAVPLAAVTIWSWYLAVPNECVRFSWWSVWIGCPGGHGFIGDDWGFRYLIVTVVAVLMGLGLKYDWKRRITRTSVLVWLSTGVLVFPYVLLDFGGWRAGIERGLRVLVVVGLATGLFGVVSEAATSQRRGVLAPTLQSGSRAKPKRSLPPWT